MPPLRKTSTVEIVVSIIESVRNERVSSLQPARAQEQQIRQWLIDRITLYKRQILESSGVPPQPSTDASMIRSPAYKKLKASPNISLPEEVVAGVRAMKVKELQLALRQRNLNSKGLKSDLRERLLAALYEEHFPKQKSEKLPAVTREIDVPMQSPEPVKQDSEARRDTPIAPMVEELVEETDSMRISDGGAKRVSMEKERDSQNEMEQDQEVIAEKSDQLTSEDGDVEMEDVGASAEVAKKSPKPSPVLKKSRSPLKRVQDSVNSAMKLFSSKSPAKKEPVASIISDKANDDKRIEERPNEERVAKSTELSASVTRNLGAPVTSSLPSGSSVAQNGGSTLKSQAVKAKNEARMAKLQEIREKSKPLPSTKSFKAPSEYLTAMSTLKTSTTTSHKTEKSRLAAEMRAKTAASTRKHQKYEPTAVKVSEPNISEKNNEPTTFKAAALSPLTKIPKSPRPEVYSPVSPMSPLDTYVISDGEDSSDSESEEEYGSQNNSKKYVPSWALKANLVPQLEKQFSERTVDPDELFGEVESCDLVAIFKRTKQRYLKRSSSGNWTKDRATSAEKLGYKQALQHRVT